MRNLRENLPNRVYHLISRLAHRAYFLDAEECTRFVELMKRVAAFSGIELLAYCEMANHVHILVFVPEPGTLRSPAESFTLRHLSPLVADGYIAPVDKDNLSLSRRAYKLTRKGEEAMK